MPAEARLELAVLGHGTRRRRRAPCPDDVGDAVDSVGAPQRIAADSPLNTQVLHYQIMEHVRQRRYPAAGFTLVELLVVLAILGLLVGIAVPQLFKYFSRAKEDAARVQIQTIASGLDLFLLDLGRYPSDQEGLKALVEPPPNLDRWSGPYVSDPSVLNDPWARPYVYHVPGRNRVVPQSEL